MLWAGSAPNAAIVVQLCGSGGESGKGAKNTGSEAGDQGQQGGLGAAGEPYRRGRVGAQARGYVQPGGRVGPAVQSLRHPPVEPAVGDERADAGYADLAAVRVAGEQEREAIRRHG